MRVVTTEEQAELLRLLRTDDVVAVRRADSEPGELVGSLEAAQILGVERTRVARYRRNGQMPRPVGKLAATTVWLRADVEAMAERREAERQRRDEMKGRGR